MVRKKLIRWLGVNRYDRLKRFVDRVWRYRNDSYSQNGEDVYLGHVFKGKKTGFYIDVGAFHPCQFSNTYLLYRRGWRGINIDANHAAIALFKTVRSRDINLCAAISETPASVTFYTWGHNSGNTISPETAQAMTVENGPPQTTLTLHTQRLDALLDRYLETGVKIDVLNVDVEGVDLSVLKSNDWSRYRPEIVIVESFQFSLEKVVNDSIYQYLVDLGYALMAWFPPSLMFRDQTHP